MGNCGTNDNLCLTGEAIKMRDINFTLPKQLGILETGTSPATAERNTISIDSLKAIVSKDHNEVDVGQYPEASEVVSDLTRSRRRKRKQENHSINRVSSKIANSKLAVLSHEKDDNKQQDSLGVEVEEGRSKDYDAAMGLLQVSDSLLDLKRCKKNFELSSTPIMGLDRSMGSACAHDDKMGLDFDTNVSSAAALGFEPTSCSMTHQKDRDENDAVNNKREKGLTTASNEAVGTTAATSAEPQKESGSLANLVFKNSGFKSAFPRRSSCSGGLLDNLGTSLQNETENKGGVGTDVNDGISMDQTETLKLRAAFAAFQSQCSVLWHLAENGSRTCRHCQSIKEEIRKLSCICGDISPGQVSVGNVATDETNSACEEPHQCSSPVASCSSGKVAESREDHEREILLVLCSQQMDSPRKDTVAQSDKEDLPMREDLCDDAEEVECHFCIDLASSQSEDLLDAEQMKKGFQGGSLDTSINCTPHMSEMEGKPKNFQTCVLESETHGLNVSMDGGASAEFGKAADNFHENADDEGECEELSDKNSKEEGCWISGLTRNSWESHGGYCTNEAENVGYIDLKCGCTSQKYGDTVGILRLFKNGKVEIQCQCSMECIQGKPMAPASFERHGGRGASKKWKETVWIVLGDSKVQFSRVKGLDAFVRRYKDSGQGRSRQPGSTKLPSHRDEFIQCKKCRKRRRFRRRTKEECRLFHDASMNCEWECSNYPYDSVLSCKDDEEREARQANRGCLRSRTCRGCIECVCVGCFACRFEDCSCRLCIEYIANNKRN